MAQTDKHTHYFHNLRDWVDHAGVVYLSNGKLSVDELKKPFLGIHDEGKLQKEIKDIIEELDIMTFIAQRQKNMVEEFIRNTKRVLCPVESQIDWRLTSDNAPSAHGSLSGSQLPKGKGVAQSPPTQSKDETQASSTKFERFKTNSDDLMRKIDRHIEELDRLKHGAEATSSSVSTSPFLQ